MNDKLIVTVAPCIPPYIAKNIPGLDLSPEGIAGEVVRAWNAGANLVHLHVWDEKGQPTQDLSAFKKTIRHIKEQCDIVIEGSTGGINSLSPAERSISLQADIELASLNPGSVNYDKGVYVNSPEDIDYWVNEMAKKGIKPDIAIFEVGMISNVIPYINDGLIQPPYLFGFVLGQQGALPATPKNLLFLSESLPANSHWSVVGHGGHDLWLNVMAMSMGGHARAGFEDNCFYKPGQQASSNAQLIERLIRIAQEIGRTVATPSEVREMFKIT